MVIVAIVLSIIGSCWYRFTIENREIKIKLFGKYSYKSIPINDLKDVYIFCGILFNGNDGRDHCGYTFLLKDIKLRYLSLRNNKLDHISITPDDPEIFFRQIKSLQLDITIQGYSLPDTRLRNLILILFFWINAAICISLTNYTMNDHFVFAGIYIVMSVIINNVLRSLVNKYMYRDYYKNLEKYAVR